MSDSLYAVYGASGFGREVMPIASDFMVKNSIPSCDLVFIDDGFEGEEVNGFKVVTYEQFLKEDRKTKYVSLAIAYSQIRKSLFEKLENDGINSWSIKHENVVKLHDVDISAGHILCPFVTLTSNIKIGKQFHANIYSYVAHDCVIGDYVTFAPGVKCNGNVVIEDHAYIGTGAIIKQGKSNRPMVIGKGAVIGMGAVVTKNVPAGETVIGNPAKPLSRSSLRGC